MYSTKQTDRLSNEPKVILYSKFLEYYVEV